MNRTTLVGFLLLAGAAALILFHYFTPSRYREIPEKPLKPDVVPVELLWQAPDTASIPGTEAGRLIRYGRELVIKTARYLGPRGAIASISNGLNCQNCHLDAGTRPWAGNFSGVSAAFPKFRSRSGLVETMEMKINDCFKRSMNGTPLDTGSREMRAMVAYINWLGKDIPEGEKPLGAGLMKVPYLDRAADPEKGKLVYAENCQRCHGSEGQGLFMPDSSGYLYPPLWGANSYNTGAGIYRLAKFVSFVKYNMPFGVTFTAPDLTDEEVWDVAAFVNSRPRPVKVFPEDWPDITKKPVDHPLGPYADPFSGNQHKFGPFGPIEKVKEAYAKGAGY